jgi:glycosyltransferase involved in cell wall biosynthesis
MKNRLRIGLLLLGDRSWIAGIEYFKNIIFALLNLPSDIRLKIEVNLICSKSKVDPSFLEAVEKKIDRLIDQEMDFFPLTIKNRICQKILFRLFKENRPDLELFLKRKKFDFVYPHFSSGSLKKHYCSAAWIPDFQHKRLPIFFSKSELEARDSYYQQITKFADKIIVSSKAAEADLHHFFPLGRNKSEILSFCTCPDPEWYSADPVPIQKKYSLPDRFFIISNQFWQHKNHLMVFHALKKLHIKSVFPTVVCTGHLHDHRWPDYSDTILQTIHKLDLSRQVYLLGLISRSDQIQLMRRSIAVIQPSRFEGWSTVVEDARVLGKIIFLSDIAVHKEQNHPHSIFFDPEDPEMLSLILKDQWNSLPLGPDTQRESAGRERNKTALQDFGYRFVEIAKGSSV